MCDLIFVLTVCFLLQLLNSERLSIFAADLQVSFLMFEALRTHLKFQLEFYLTKLIDIIVSDSMKITYEHKELALDNILQLWRIPGFVTELYLNYDCDMYCTNLYEDLTKLLAKNAFPATAGVYPTHLLSLDALLTVIDSIGNHCTKSGVESAIEQTKDAIEPIEKFIGKNQRQKVSNIVPTREQLLAIKNTKRVSKKMKKHLLSFSLVNKRKRFNFENLGSLNSNKKKRKFKNKNSCNNYQYIISKLN